MTTPKRNQVREKKSDHVSPKKPLPITATEASPKKSQKKKESTKATTEAEKDPLKVFSKTWNELATVLRNRFVTFSLIIDSLYCVECEFGSGARRTLRKA